LGILATSNLAFGIVPCSNINANGAIAFAQRLQNALPSGSIVYYWEFNTDDSFMSYFDPQSHWLPVTSVDAIDAALHGGESVWLETTALDHFTRHNPAWLAARTLNTKRIELVNYQHRIQFVLLGKPGTDTIFPGSLPLLAGISG
jgi:hypothetical protein